MADQATYPMLSEKSWWILRERFKASIPTSFSSTFVKSLLSLSSDASANNNIIVPMKRLGLIDDDNKPTALANDWRIDDKYRSTCDAIVKAVYPTELIDLFPDATVDRTVAKNWFMSHGVGSKTADSMISLFTLLKSGEIKEKQNRSSPTAQKPKTKAKTRTEKETILTPESSPLSVDPPVEDAKSPVGVNNRPNLHIDLQIHISPESTPEQIETIFACMAKHLYGVDNP